MVKRLLVVSLAFVAIFLAGCADPLTQKMNDLGFVPLVPAPAKANLGDIYASVNIARDNNPYLVMRDIDPAYATSLMKQKENEVTVPDFSTEKTYDLNVNANIVGKLTMELQAKNATKFSITFGGTKQYILDQLTWQRETLPAIRNKVPNGLQTDGKFLVRGLLFVTSLEYTFYNSSNGKIDIKTDPSLSKAINAEIGGDWQITDQGTLKISPDSPRFIGYKIGLIKGDAFSPVAASTPAEIIVVDPNLLGSQVK